MARYRNGSAMKVCVCGHNDSQHRLEQDRFRGGWDTSCRFVFRDRPGGERCNCGAFRLPEPMNRWDTDTEAGAIGGKP